MASQDMTTILTATYNDPAERPNPNIKGRGRLVTITRDGDTVRIRIVGAPFITNDPMIVVQDSVIPAAAWADHGPRVEQHLAELGAVVTRPAGVADGAAQ